MHRISIVQLGICLSLLAACSPVTKDIKVSTVYNPAVHYDRLRTYSWVGVISSLNDPDERWAERELDVFAEIKWLIDREMRERGFFEVTDNADIGVVFALALDTEVFKEIDDPNSDAVNFAKIPQGALFTALVDPKTLYAVWIGTATADVLDNPTFETTQKRLDYGISKMFSQLPR